MMQDLRLGWSYRVASTVQEQSTNIIPGSHAEEQLYTPVPPRGSLHESLFESAEGKVSYIIS